MHAERESNSREVMVSIGGSEMKARSGEFVEVIEDKRRKRVTCYYIFCLYNLSLYTGGKVAICVKGVDFKQDISTSLLEWLLLAQEQEYGAVYLYSYSSFGLTSRKIIKCGAICKARSSRDISFQGTSGNFTSST